MKFYHPDLCICHAHFPHRDKKCFAKNRRVCFSPKGVITLGHITLVTSSPEMDSPVWG